MILPGIGKAYSCTLTLMGSPSLGPKKEWRPEWRPDCPHLPPPTGRLWPRVGGERFSIFHTQPKTCELSKLTGARTNGGYSWLHSILPHDEAGICDRSCLWHFLICC